MKTLRCIIALVVLTAASAFPQTKDLGQGAFANRESDIMIAVDAGVAVRTPDSPYVMFVVYMASKKPGRNIIVSRDDVVLVYNGREHKMPSLREFRRNYGAGARDANLYRHLGKEGIASSWMRFYEFPASGDFFPPLTFRSQIRAEEGFMTGFNGFVSRCYFKNPGLKKGDRIVIRVTAKNKPELAGEVAVVL
jgi:hypothetical protein